MKILAIDPATKTGYAHSDGPSGVWDFTTKQDESLGMRLWKFRKELREIYFSFPFDFIVFEAARGMGMQRALVSHAEFQGIIKEFCLSKKIDYKGYSSTEIKKHATADGAAKKEEMISRAEFKFRTEIIDDNHADALWLLDLAKVEFRAKDAPDTELPSAREAAG